MEQFFTVYGGTLLMGFFVTLFLLASILFFQRWYRPQAVHHTSTPVSRLGGVALIVSFLLVLWQSPIPSFPESWWVFSGVLLMILVVGLWDDVSNIDWKYQLVAQFSILTILYLGGVKIVTLTNPEGGAFVFTGNGLMLVGFFLFLLWGSLVLNSINWLDGVDGLCGSVMAVVYATLFVLALSPAVYQPAIAILLVAALGITGAFLIYNYPPARIIGGTSGSLFFGVVVVFVSVVAGTKIATTLLVLALPIMDSLFVLLKRMVQKRSLFAPDREHLHHVLQRRGWSNQRIVIAYTLLTLCISSIALSSQSLGKLTAIILVFSIIGIILTFFHFPKRFAKKWVVGIGGISSVVFLVIFLLFGISQDTQNAFIGGHWYALEQAVTPEARAAGLSGRESLCLHCGMIFIFPEPITPSFWMKDMHFSLDVLWILDDRVVAKHENLPFPSLETFGPGQPVTKVIELPAGTTRDVRIGTKIYFW